MYVITFYSFKGGVGRTMALVNVAVELVRRGRKVLLVDFDLEAPGLETYEHLRPKQPHPGIVEYVTEFRRTQEVPDLLKYTYEPKPLGRSFLNYTNQAAKLGIEAPEVGLRGGRLWVMPAGRRDRAYHNALTDLDWKRLYQDEGGFLLFEDTKKGWEKELKPDYVLIDSRTGDTDVLGICTRQLPDSVVLMFTPNEQNLVGLENVCRDIRREETEGLKKKIRLYFVASNVPNLDDEHSILRRQIKAFREVLVISRDTPIPIVHRNETLQMLDQPVFILHRPRSRLAGEYRRMVDSLIMENPVDRAGTVLYLRTLERERAIRQNWRYTRAVKVRLEQIESQFSSDPEILLQLARWFQGQGDVGAALQKFDRVVALQPERQDLLLDRGRCRRQTGDKKGAADDLLGYLHSLPRVYDEQERLLHLDENIVTALEELFNALGVEFLMALNAPVLNQDIWNRPDSAFCAWFEAPAVSLIRERRWKDAISYLDIGNEAPKDVKQALLNFQGQRRFYLAMARWGETGTLSPDLCGDADDYVPSIGAANCQRLALLYWGIGDKKAAFHFLDLALASLDAVRGLTSISCWTFREASSQEFREHCEEMRRMFQGERLLPPFLGRGPTTTS
jgi:MinD-like ATPase involved in chromosome partitioning or flagellar assembly